MDRKSRIALLVEHFERPRHKGTLEDADVVMPGGSPECGGSVVVYLKGDGNGGVEALSWTGQGDTISMGATSIVVERILTRASGMDEILDLDYEELVESLGRDMIGPHQARHAGSLHRKGRHPTVPARPAHARHGQTSSIAQ